MWVAMADDTEIFAAKSPLHKTLDQWLVPDGEPFPGETLRADGWEYRDLPRMSPEYFDKFMALVGPENIRWLTFADYGDTKRGQCFISPTGLQHLRDYAATEEKT